MRRALCSPAPALLYTEIYDPTPTTIRDRRHHVCQCGKRMVMLSFNYTSLEQSFESISL